MYHIPWCFFIQLIQKYCSPACASESHCLYTHETSTLYFDTYLDFFHVLSAFPFFSVGFVLVILFLLLCFV